jgi:hypothetical protein
LNRLAREQFAVIHRAQALECGMTRSAVDYRIRDGGPWQVLLPGVYATTTGTVTVDQRAMAALLHAGPGSVITGAAAVRRHRLACAGLNEIDVLAPASTRVQSMGFVRVMRTKRMPNSYYSTRQIRFACLPRAVADAARGMSRLSDVRAVVSEAVQKGRCEIPSLVAELDAGPAAGSRRFRLALTEVSDGIRSAAEADLRTIIIKSDLETPMYNARLYLPDGTELGIADAWWQRAGVVAEVDSRQYHLRAADYERTTKRHNRMEAENINLLHFLPSMIRQEPEIVLRDLRKAIDSGSRREPLPIVAVPVGAPSPVPQHAGGPPTAR